MSERRVNISDYDIDWNKHFGIGTFGYSVLALHKPTNDQVALRVLRVDIGADRQQDFIR
jgi:hypothetical protein